MENGLLDRRESFDLLDNLDFGIMELGMSDEEPSSADNASAVEKASTATPTDGKVSGEGRATATATATVSPPVVAAAAAAASAKAAASAAAQVGPFRNSENSVQDGGATDSSIKPAPAATVGQGDNAHADAHAHAQGSAEKAAAKARGGGDGARGGGQDSEQEINVSLYLRLFSCVVLCDGGVVAALTVFNQRVSNRVCLRKTCCWGYWSFFVSRTTGHRLNPVGAQDTRHKDFIAV